MKETRRATVRNVGLRHMCMVTCLLSAPVHATAQVLPIAEARPERFLSAIHAARRVIASAMQEERIPGASVAVGVDGMTVWSEGFGWANVEQRVPVTTLTKFRVGSIAKPLTTTALGVLIDRRVVDIDVPIQNYVPTFPTKRWPITLRQIAGHTAGIRHYRGDEFYSAERYDNVLSSLAIFDEDSLLFEPGTTYSYSTHGFSLIGAAIEAAAGTDFLTFMRDEVFQPLGLRNTVADHNGAVIFDRASFYVWNEKGEVVNAPYVDNSSKWAGGGFLSTPEDMVRFGQELMRPGFLTDETLSLLQTSQTTRSGARTGYGLGWFEGSQEDGDRIISHSGSSVGGSTLLILLPEHELVVAGVINISGGVRPVVEEVAEIFESHLESSLSR